MILLSLLAILGLLASVLRRFQAHPGQDVPLQHCHELGIARPHPQGSDLLDPRQQLVILPAGPVERQAQSGHEGVAGVEHAELTNPLYRVLFGRDRIRRCTDAPGGTLARLGGNLKSDRPLEGLTVTWRGLSGGALGGAWGGPGGAWGGLGSGLIFHFAGVWCGRGRSAMVAADIGGLES